LYCWGANRTYGQFDATTVGVLGLGDDFDDQDRVLEPTQVGTATTWVSVAAGQTHACGIQEDETERTLWCWGRNINGQLGNGTEVDSNVPVQESGTYTDWAEVQLSAHHAESCGIRDSGTERTLWCWGSVPNGLTGGDDPTQNGVVTKWKSIAIGAWEFCGIQEDGTDKTLWCTGRNRHGQQGNGVANSSDVATLTQLGTDVDWEAISGGIGFFCALKGGALYCWGRDHVGELGVTDDPSMFASCVNDVHGGDAEWDCLVPEAVNDEVTWGSLSKANRHACGLDEDGHLYCWGWNKFGQAGQPTTDPVTWVPTQVGS